MPEDPRKTKRPKTVNELLLDRAIRHAIYVTRLAGGEAKWLKEQIPSFRRRVMDEISPLITQVEGGEGFSITDQRLIREASEKAARVAEDVFSQIRDEHIARLGRVASQEIDFEQKLFQKAIPIEMEFTRPSDSTVRSLLSNQPISGKTLDQWFSDIPNNLRLAINNELQEGMLEGESVANLLRRVRGRREFGFADGLISRAGGQAEGLVRTGVMKASNTARSAFHEQNKDVIKGWEVVITLDSRTCMQCVERESGNPYDVNNKPDPPFHPRCRCLVTAVTKSWQELGIDLDEAPPGTRASMQGEVPDTMTYQDWFEDQSADLQKDILGPSRYEAFKKGQPVTAFADRGEVLSLDQLRAREPDLFDLSEN